VARSRGAILVRYEKKAVNYLGLIKVACILLWYRRLHRLSLLRYSYLAPAQLLEEGAEHVPLWEA